MIKGKIKWKESLLDWDLGCWSWDLLDPLSQVKVTALGVPQGLLLVSPSTSFPAFLSTLLYFWSVLWNIVHFWKCPCVWQNATVMCVFCKMRHFVIYCSFQTKVFLFWKMLLSIVSFCFEKCGLTSCLLKCSFVTFPKNDVVVFWPSGPPQFPHNFKIRSKRHHVQWSFKPVRFIAHMPDTNKVLCQK